MKLNRNALKLVLLSILIPVTFVTEALSINTQYHEFSLREARNSGFEIEFEEGGATCTLINLKIPREKYGSLLQAIYLVYKNGEISAQLDFTLENEIAMSRFCSSKNYFEDIRIRINFGFLPEHPLDSVEISIQ